MCKCMHGLGHFIQFPNMESILHEFAPVHTQKLHTPLLPSVAHMLPTVHIQYRFIPPDTVNPVYDTAHGSILCLGLLMLYCNYVLSVDVTMVSNAINNTRAL